MKNFKYIVSIIFLMSSVDVLANECSGPKYDSVELETECLSKLIDIQESKLNKIYKESYFGTEADAGFTAAQLAWKNYRNKQCESEVQSFGGGVGGRAIEAECYLELTKQRVQYLK